MLDHAGHVAQGAGERDRIGYLAELAVENVMAFVGGESIAIGVVAESDLRAEGGELPGEQAFGKRYHFDRQGEFTEMRHLLGGVSDDDELLCRRGNNLFAQ